MSLEIKYRSAIFATRATRSSHTGVTQHTSNGCPLLLYQNQQIVQVITKSNLKSLEIKIDSTAKYSLFSNICHLHLQITTPQLPLPFFCRLARSHVRFIQLLNSCALGDRWWAPHGCPNHHHELHRNRGLSQIFLAELLWLALFGKKNTRT